MFPILNFYNLNICCSHEIAMLCFKLKNYTDLLNNIKAYDKDNRAEI